MKRLIYLINAPIGETVHKQNIYVLKLGGEQKAFAQTPNNKAYYVMSIDEAEPFMENAKPVDAKDDDSFDNMLTSLEKNDGVVPLRTALAFINKNIIRTGNS